MKKTGTSLGVSVSRAPRVEVCYIPRMQLLAPGPIRTEHLFPRLEARLVELLASLTAEDWQRQTLAPRWTVKEVAAHLLDTELRVLSGARDGYFWERPKINSDAELVAHINRLNAEGVSRLRHLSPQLLIALIAWTSAQLSSYFASLDPNAAAPFGVSWAGERESANWFNTAREFTERWHHQQQIREAVGKPGIMVREFYYPVLDCFMRALPHAYREVRAKDDALLEFTVAGECGGQWYLWRHGNRWQLVTQPEGVTVAQVTIPQEIAWRIFTKGIDRAAGIAQIKVEGDTGLGVHVLSALAIVG